MSSPADQFSILNKSGQNPNFQRPQAKPKVQRYRKGQGPEHEEPEDDDNDDIFPISNYTVGDDNFSVAESSLTTQKTREEEQQLSERLKKRRQVQRSVIVEESKAEDQAPARERMETEKQENNAEEEVDNVARRRAKLKEKLLEQEKVAEDDIHLQNINEEDEMEEEDNEPEQEAGIISMLKPVFVSKHEREVNKEKLEEEIALQEEQRRLKEKRKVETKMLLIEAIKKDDEAEKDEDNLSGGEMPNDDDDIDEANQYEQWKIRELKRLKRSREERNKRDKERAEIERRRRLTDAERAHENKVLGSDDTLKPEKLQYKFMQKYYHKGAFYQDSDDPIFKRDYNVGVGEDMWDKSGLPSILQKRRGEFGMRGASKYTHLTDQDTTNFDPQFRVDENLLGQARNKQAGFKGSNTMDRPTARKR